MGWGSAWTEVIFLLVFIAVVFKTLSKHLMVCVWMCVCITVPHIEHIFLYILLQWGRCISHGMALMIEWLRRPRPKTFGSIIHQPTTPATNNYIFVGGGGWGPVAHCPVNHPHTHMHSLSHTLKHPNDLTTSKWHNQVWPKHFEVIFSPGSWLEGWHLELILASSGGKWAALWVVLYRRSLNVVCVL